MDNNLRKKKKEKSILHLQWCDLLHVDSLLSMQINRRTLTNDRQVIYILLFCHNDLLFVASVAQYSNARKRRKKKIEVNEEKESDKKTSGFM